MSSEHATERPDQTTEAFSVVLSEPMQESLAALLDDDMAIDESHVQVVIEIDGVGVLAVNNYVLRRDGEWEVRGA